jgi:hypothetical protein
MNGKRAVARKQSQAFDLANCEQQPVERIAGARLRLDVGEDMLAGDREQRDSTHVEIIGKAVRR